MYSSCVFICEYLCLCNGVSPDINTILQVHRWLCLAVQVMFHARMTPIAKASIDNSKYRKCSWLSRLHIQLPISLLLKIRLSRPQSGGQFENIEISNTASIWPYTWKDRHKWCYKTYFFRVMISSIMSQWDPKVAICIHFGEIKFCCRIIIEIANHVT